MGLLSLIARLTLNASGFEQGIKRAQSLTTKFGKDVAGTVKGQLAAAFGAGAILSMTKAAIDSAGHIGDLSKRLSVSAEALQEFDYIAMQNGTTLDAFSSAIEKTSRSQVEAVQGNQDMIDSFGRFGISLSQLKTLSADQLFRLIAQSMEKTGQTSLKTNDALSIMGKSAGEIIPSMVSGFSQLADEAHRFGSVLSQDLIDRLGDIGDKMGELKFRSRGWLGRLTLFGADTAKGFVDDRMRWAKLLGGAMVSMIPGMHGAGTDIASEGLIPETDEEGVPSEATMQRRLRAAKAKRASKDLAQQVAKASETHASSKAKTEINLSTLQQIGAFVGSNPVIIEQQKTNAILERLDKKLPYIPPETMTQLHNAFAELTGL